MASSALEAALERLADKGIKPLVIDMSTSPIDKDLFRERSKNGAIPTKQKNIVL